MAYFSTETFDFLMDLEINNHKAWMDENRDRYETFVRDPLYAFCDDWAEPLKQNVSPHLVSVGRIQRGSVMQINRDVRFSDDKTPYRTSMAAYFRHAGGEGAVHAPGLYLHLEPGNCFFGGGVHSPPVKALTPIRERIVDRTEEWDRVVETLDEAGLELGGDKLKTSPQGFDSDHERIEDLRRTSFVVMRPLTEDEVTSEGFIDLLLDRAKDTVPFMGFLAASYGLPF